MAKTYPTQPIPTTTQKIGKNTHKPIPKDISPATTPEEVKHIQQIVSSIFYYARVIYLTVLMALSTIASRQTKPMTDTLLALQTLLDYLAAH